MEHGQRRELGVLLFVANRALEQRAFEAIVAAGYTDITVAQSRVAARIGPGGTRVQALAEFRAPAAVAPSNRQRATPIQLRPERRRPDCPHPVA